MSIATLKRKTQAKYNNNSANQPQFSLNGTRRSSGYVGQDTLGRSLVRSLAGSDGSLKGHGGCCGTYPIHQISRSPEMAPLNNPNVIKSSSVNNNGLLMSKYRWTRRPQPFTVWKPSDHLNNGDQSSYIRYLARKTIAESCHDASGNTKPTNCCNISTSTNKRIFSRNKVPTITKPASFLSTVSYSEYIQTLSQKCTGEEVFFIRKNTQGVPLAGGSN